MDYSIWTGVLLLSGAVGATMMFDRDPAEEDDPVQAQADLPHHPVAAPADPEHDIAADRDALAWFLDGTEGPGDLSTPHATEDEAAARPDDLVIPLDGSPDLPLIEGFQPGGHTLELVYTPATDPATGEALPPALSIAATEDGSSSIISLDGTEVAELAGVTGLTPADISLVPEVPHAAQAAA